MKKYKYNKLYLTLAVVLSVFTASMPILKASADTPTLTETDTTIMTETFSGKTAGAMTSTAVESGSGSWRTTDIWGDPLQYAAYTNADGESDIGVRAGGNWNRLLYDAGADFAAQLSNGCEITVGFDFVTPAAVTEGSWHIMDLGDGPTNQYHNITIFAVGVQEGKYCLTHCVDTSGRALHDGAYNNLPFAWLNTSTVYTFEAKAYPDSNMTYATLKKGDEVVYSGFYRMSQWRNVTDGFNIHTLFMTDNNTGIIFDNFKISAKTFSVTPPLGKTLDFNTFVNKGFLDVIRGGASAKFVPAPENNGTDMGSALHVVGDNQGIALPYFSEPVSTGVYRYTTMIYNEYLPEKGHSRIMIEAPKGLEGYDGLLTLAHLHDNSVGLSDNGDKITVAPNEWIGVETIIDLDNKKTHLAAYDKNSHKLGTVSEAFPDGVQSINSVRIRNWGGTEFDAVIDNMKLEKVDGGIGFTKAGKTVETLTAGDELKVGFSLLDMLSADVDVNCIVAFYDEQDILMFAKILAMPVKAGCGFAVSSDTVTVPQGAAKVKAFAWHAGYISPVAQPIALLAA